MAKEFDIYLRKRVHECDLIVLSLPFRDGLTVTNRMILESCVKSYLLYEFAAVQSGVDIASHIDEMLKICYEMLSFGTHIGISAEFQTHYSFYPNENIIELGSSDIPMLATMFTSARLPRKCPRKELQKFRMRFVIPPPFINAPASINPGMQSRVKESMPA